MGPLSLTLNNILFLSYCSWLNDLFIIIIIIIIFIFYLFSLFLFLFLLKIKQKPTSITYAFWRCCRCEKKHKHTLPIKGECPFILTDSTVLSAFGTACSRPIMPNWARSMRFIYCWHTKKDAGHLRSYLLFATYLELICTSNVAWAVQKSRLSTVTARANHTRMERSRPEAFTWRTCLQQSHEVIPHTCWSAHRGSDQLVEWSKMRNWANPSF